MKKDNKRRYDILKSGVCECASVCVCVCLCTHTHIVICCFQPPPPYSHNRLAAGIMLFTGTDYQWWCSQVVLWHLMICVCVCVWAWRCGDAQPPRKLTWRLYLRRKWNYCRYYRNVFKSFCSFSYATHTEILSYAINYSSVNRKAESTRLETNEMLSVAHSLECSP